MAVLENNPLLRYLVATYYDESYPPDILDGGGPPPVVNDPHIDSLTPNTGVVDTEATFVVAGTLFDADAVIEVDTVAVPTTAKSATSLTGTYTPAAAGPKQVTVRNVGAAKESNNTLFTVTAVVEDAAQATEQSTGTRQRRTRPDESE